MATLLSFGYKLPVSGERGATFFPALEDNITRTNTHNHDGSNSAPLAPSSYSTTAVLALYTSTINSASWAAVSGKSGLYSQVVTVPAAVTEINNYTVYFYNSSGQRLLLALERVSATTYTVYINDNSLTITALYK
jgi:hypothetical protein